MWKERYGGRRYGEMRGKWKEEVIGMEEGEVWRKKRYKEKINMEEGEVWRKER